MEKQQAWILIGVGVVVLLVIGYIAWKSGGHGGKGGKAPALTPSPNGHGVQAPTESLSDMSIQAKVLEGLPQ